MKDKNNNPFAYLNSINSTKQDLMTGTANDKLAEKLYAPWLTNSMLARHIDTIESANMMNLYWHLDNKLQYDFLLYTVRKRKRYSKSTKKVDDKDAKIVSEFYKVSLKKAFEYLTILTDEQLNEIRRIFNNGK